MQMQKAADGIAHAVVPGLLSILRSSRTLIPSRWRSRRVAASCRPPIPMISAGWPAPYRTVVIEQLARKKGSPD
jgi:hypothetical protein